MKNNKPTNYIHTYTGGFFDYLSKDPNKFNVEDAAHSLALINRFAGHTTKPYSVGKHLCICCYVAPEELKLEALFHDYLESSICDIPSPLKKLPFMQGYRDYEEEQEQLLIKKFGLNGIKPGIVADIDHDMSYLEARAFLNFDKRMWKEPKDLQVRLKLYKKQCPEFLTHIETDWTIEETEEEFLKLYEQYRRTK